MCEMCGQDKSRSDLFYYIRVHIDEPMCKIQNDLYPNNYNGLCLIKMTSLSLH